MSYTPYSTSSPKNAFQAKLNTISNESTQPSNEERTVTYGLISEVNYDNNQVKVKLLDGSENLRDVLPDRFYPLATPLSEIHLLWGALRVGLVTRISWRGTGTPHSAIVEVIGDEEHSFLKKKPEPNELPVGPFLVFSPGGI